MSSFFVESLAQSVMPPYCTECRDSLRQKNSRPSASPSDIDLSETTVAGVRGRIVRVADLPRKYAPSHHVGRSTYPTYEAAHVASDERYARELHEQQQTALQREQDVSDKRSASLALSVSWEDSDTMSHIESPRPSAPVSPKTRPALADIAQHLCVASIRRLPVVISCFPGRGGRPPSFL